MKNEKLVIAIAVMIVLGALWGLMALVQNALPDAPTPLASPSVSPSPLVKF